MQTLFFILILAVNITGFVLLFKYLKQQQQPKDDASLQMLNNNIQGMQERLDKVSHGLNQRLDNAAQVIGNVSKELGGLQEIGRNMQGLQDFLKSPKLRGNIGEQVLQQMLDQAFPAGMYDVQFKFRTGQVVDAIVRTDDGLIPIDSKFPMENFQRLSRTDNEEDRARFRKEFLKDVKKHVNDIAKKYILPEEGTVDFAVMYVPSEAIYYEIIREDIDLNAHGIEKKVLFVSPNSFYYFLRVIMMGMQGKKMAEATREIIASVRGLQKDAGKFSESLGVLNTHLTHAKGALERVDSDYAKMEGKIAQLGEVDESTLLQ